MIVRKSQRMRTPRSGAFIAVATSAADFPPAPDPICENKSSSIAVFNAAVR